MAPFAEPDGAIAEHYTYNAYGKSTVHTPTFGSRQSSNYTWNYHYTTRRLDPETGFMHYRNRYYHAEMGRFINRDPIGYEGNDENLYRYVGGTDPKANTSVNCQKCRRMEAKAYEAQCSYQFTSPSTITQCIRAGVCYSCKSRCNTKKCPPFPTEIHPIPGFPPLPPLVPDLPEIEVPELEIPEPEVQVPIMELSCCG